MRQLFSVIVISFLVITGCIAPQNILETSPIMEGDTLSFRGYVYSLPQTSFKIKIEVVKTRTIRGPYYRFAEKLLSIKDVPKQNSNSYSISRVNLETYEEADPGHVYLVRQVSGQTDLSGLLELDREGLIFNNRQSAGVGDPFILEGSSFEGPEFTELSMERNTAMSIDTFYKTILTDTSFIRVPVLKEQLIVKTFDEKAVEAADFILELRYERFMMLTGNNNTPVSDYGVQRLDEIEREYLELFIGKSVEEKFSYSFFITPSGDEIFENIEILEFSESRGILEEGTGDSEPLSLSIRNTGKTQLLKDPLSPEKLPIVKNSLYYRVPDIAEVGISLGSSILLNGRYPISQNGQVLTLPVGSLVE